jgi:uncharacterized protein (TIGR00288 family)
VLGIIKRVKKKEPQQKGVDTQTAVHMVSKAYENQFDIAILMTGDEDFLPVVDAIKSAGKRVYSIFFESHVSQNLKEAFDNSLMLTKEWFINQSLKGKVALEKFRIQFES